MSTETKNKITTEEEALHFVSLNRSNLKDVPVKLMTKKVCDLAFKLNPYESTYVYIPEKHRTFAMALKACPDYGAETKDFATHQLKEEWGISPSGMAALVKKGTLPNLKKVTDPEIALLCYKKAFSQDVGIIDSMPDYIITEVVKTSHDVNKIIGHYKSSGYNSTSWAGGKLVHFVPEHLMTAAAIENLQDNLKTMAEQGKTGLFFDAPSDYITDDLYKIMLEKSPNSLESVPKVRITKEMCDIAVKKDGRALKSVPQDMQENYYLDAVKSGKGLHIIPEENRTDRLCTLAVEKEASQYEYVPEDKKTYAISLQAVDNRCDMIEHVPTELIDQEMMVRLITSIFKKTWEYDFSLNDVSSYKKEKGQTQPVLKTVFDEYFKDAERSYKRKEELRELMHEVISRDGMLYFAMLDFSGENDSNEGHHTFNSGRWKTYFEGCVEFSHAVTAARQNIETVTGFRQNVQARVWTEFLKNN